ncbi:MAG TPA: hypothetical protein VEL76_03090 [Gemmataceae bacterium]|nr:hypothetical protein [Gemmataceae bacterium]
MRSPPSNWVDMGKPLLVRLGEGEWWTVATDGRALVALPWRVEGVNEASERATKAFTQFLTARPIGRAVPWLDLKAWVGPVAPLTHCGCCGGIAIFGEAGDDIPCPECEGTGSWQPQRNGLLFGVLLDRQLLARFTALLDADDGPLRAAVAVAGQDSVAADLLRNLHLSDQTITARLEARSVLADRLEELGHLALARLFHRPPVVQVALATERPCYFDTGGWRVVCMPLAPSAAGTLGPSDCFPPE